MTIVSALRILVLLQAAAAGLALTTAGSGTAATGVLMMLITAISWVIGGNWPSNPRRSKYFWNIMALVMMIFFLSEVIVFRDLLPPVVRLVVFLTAYKLFNLNFNRDYFTVYMLTFLQLLAAASISYDYMFAIPFILYIITSALALVLQTIKMGREREQFTRSLITGMSPAVDSPRVPARRLSGAFLISITVIAIAVVVFPLLPRFRTDIIASGARNPLHHLSGFSEIVSLDALSDIKTSGRVVMRVTLSGDGEALRERLRLRGITLSYFDGNRWIHSNRGGGYISRSSDGNYYINDYPDERNIQQEILINPLSTRAIFSIGLTERVRGPFGRIWADGMSSLFMTKRNFSQFRYVTNNYLPSLDIPVLQAVPLHNEERTLAQYLQLPNNASFSLTDRYQVQELVRQIIGNADNRYDAVRRLEQYLKTQFEYSLELSRYRNDEKKLMSFLFDRRIGHCEYFATALAVMARSIGIPSRLVNGFQMGQYNPFGGFYTVRAADAHSWTEIYFPGHGWVEFDPTPAGGQESNFAAETPNFFMGFIESIDLWWTQYILAFDAIDQYELYAGLSNVAREALKAVNRATDALLALIPALEAGSLFHTILRIIVQLIAVIILSLIVYSAILRPLAKLIMGSRKQDDQQISFFQQAVELLKRHGYELQETSTVREMAMTLETESFGKLFSDIGRSYEMARFSHDDLLIRRAYAQGKRRLELLRTAFESLSGKS
jgi:hypothetical protein